MKGLTRAVLLGMGVMIALLALGFITFATLVTRPPALADHRAKGIVVLTGEGRRIAEGARLLKEGRAERMLISGVNPRIGKKAIMRISGLPEQKFDCCVDLGYQALDTAGNADEARTWAAAHNYDSLIVVTASYHMPRSLAEFSLSSPKTRLIPHPVMSRKSPSDGWWLHRSTASILLSEYLKFLSSIVQLTFAQVTGFSQAPSLAKAPAGRQAGL